MFKHSVKVPRLYKIAAKVAKDVKEGIGSIKQLVYDNKSKHPNIKAIYALVATLFQRSDEIENLLKRSQLLEKEPRSDPWLTKILIVELLWGKKCLPGNSKPEKTVLAYEQIFKAHISDIPVEPIENDLNSKEELKPRYVRVNTLFMSLNEAIDSFRDEGWIFSRFLDKNDYNGFIERIASLSEGEFLVDIHIPDLLIFPPKTQFYNHPAYKNGCIILQDKASCLPIHILAPPKGSVVLDMCSAPGMKTTQAAAAMNNEGKVYAVERDPRRFEVLNRIVQASGATCVTTVNKDVLTCTQKDFPGVQYILVDPSCSGSGMTGRLGFEQSKSNQRIENLAGFQIKILRTALTKFPDAKRVVYSTCSVFQEENEDVVRQVLETNSSFKLVPATNFVNNSWKNFGSSEYGDIGSYCLYAKPNEDFTNGFFVAVFERLEEGEENKFFNTKIYNFKKHLQSQQNRKRRQQQINFENSSNDNTQNGESMEYVKSEITGGYGAANNSVNYYGQSEPNLDNEKIRKKSKSKFVDDPHVNVKEEKVEFGNEYVKEELSEPAKKIKKKKKGKDLFETGDGFYVEPTVKKETEGKIDKKGKALSKTDGCFPFEQAVKKEKEENLDIEEDLSELLKKPKKKKKDKYISKNIDLEIDPSVVKDEETEELENESVKEEPSKRKKKKKKYKDESENDTFTDFDLEIVPHVKKEKELAVEFTNETLPTSDKLKRKKKKDADLSENNDDVGTDFEPERCITKKRKILDDDSESNALLLKTAYAAKKKRGLKSILDNDESFQMDAETIKVKKKKRQKDVGDEVVNVKSKKIPNDM